MKRAAKAWLIVAAALIIIGIVLCGLACIPALRTGETILASAEKTLQSFGSAMRTETYTFDGILKDIDVTTDVADLILLLSPDGKISVECVEEENCPHTVKLEQGKLTVEPKEEWGFIGTGLHTNLKVTVFVPADAVPSVTFTTGTGDLKTDPRMPLKSLRMHGTTGEAECLSKVEGTVSITLTTGNAELNGITAENMDITVTTGSVEIESVTVAKNMLLAATTGETELENTVVGGSITHKCTTGETELENVCCGSFRSEGTTGSLKLTNTLAEQRMGAERATGSITLDQTDAGEMVFTTTTGSVTGTVLTGKIFSADTRTGSVQLPTSEAGGNCHISTTTGDIKIAVKGSAQSNPS